MSPFIGIILPTYNRKELLNRAIDSILMQTYKTWFICIVDDGSKDGTVEFLHKYLDHPKIHFIAQKSNQGVNAARNAALQYLMVQQQCDFVTLLDDDDYFNPNTLEVACNIITQNPNEKWFVSRKVSENGKSITHIKTFGSVAYINYYLGITMDHDATHIISTSLIKDIRFSKEFKQAEEWVFFMKLAKNSTMFTYDFPSTVCSYLEDGLSAQVQQKSSNNNHTQNVNTLKEKYLEDLGYKKATTEMLKLTYRINRTIQSKKYYKLFRYVPRYIYWKLKDLLT